MRYESRHLFFAVVLNTVTPTIHKSKISRRGSLRAVRFSSPPCALPRLYKGFRVFNPLLIASLNGGARGARFGFLKRVPPSRPPRSLFCNGASSPPANARKTAFKKILLFLIPAPSFAEETGVCFQAHVPRKQKVRAALRTKHLEPKGMARGENTVTARERGVG